MTRPPRVLAIAGTDPTGGAGLQADLKSIAAHDGYGMGVVTALVAQNTRGVRAVHVPEVGFLREQLDAVSDDVEIDAVKTGMLGTADVVRTVVSWLREHRPPFLVVDPVMVASSGDRLLDADAERAMTELVALADLVTPNRDELAVLHGLAGADGGDDADPVEGADPVDAANPVDAALAVAARWGVLVLAKGGHDDGAESTDLLVAPDGTVRAFSAARVRTTNTHGTGCSLASAIATVVARAGDWDIAVGTSKAWITRAVGAADALEVGSGHGPVDHLVDLRRPFRHTDAWWADAAGTLEDTVGGEFLRTLADGTLDPDGFAAYLAQDVHYLLAYQEHLAAIGRSSTGAAAAFWTGAAAACADEARDLHARRLAGSRADDAVHRFCAGYLEHLASAAATGSVAVLAAAVLPCFRVYAFVGSRLAAGAAAEAAAAAPAAGRHPFADWLAAYSDPGFAASSGRATELVEELAVAADVTERGAMATAFRRSVRWEESFFAIGVEEHGRATP